MDYVIALSLDKYSSQPLRKFILTVSLVANLGLLGYFKYANFFLDSLEQSLVAGGMDATLAFSQTHLHPLYLILPIGISFYTFEAINYTVDVYRKKTPAERNLANFMLFITFFP